jgi:hypothetical protein
MPNFSFQPLQLSLKLQNATDQNSESELLSRFCGGKFFWRISNFSRHFQKLRLDKSQVLYSQGFYTSPNGYKVEICIWLIFY